MLDQATVDLLLQLEKVLVERGDIQFPVFGAKEQLHVTSRDGREAFVIDINRSGRIKITKCTFQERYQAVEILLRLDIDGPTHENPDGTEAPCPHLHVYREGFADKWAYPLPADFTDPGDLVLTLRQFLRFCNIADIPPIQGSM